MLQLVNEVDHVFTQRGSVDPEHVAPVLEARVLRLGREDKQLSSNQLAKILTDRKQNKKTHKKEDKKSHVTH